MIVSIQIFEGGSKDGFLWDFDADAAFIRKIITIEQNQNFNGSIVSLFNRTKKSFGNHNIERKQGTGETFLSVKSVFSEQNGYLYNIRWNIVSGFSKRKTFRIVFDLNVENLFRKQRFFCVEETNVLGQGVYKAGIKDLIIKLFKLILKEAANGKKFVYQCMRIKFIK